MLVELLLMAHVLVLERAAGLDRHLAGLLLLSPMLDDRMQAPSSHLTGDLLWSRTSNQTGWRMLLGDRAGADGVSSYAAPGRATDLSGLPPTFIGVGSVELFRDGDVAFASTIWASGGDAELHVWPGGFHGIEDMAPHSALAPTPSRHVTAG
ncbi:MULTISPECIES: alpha/beta hydrolase fold domain-containing protein [Pseudofrankia]|uniref:alpha/beta hydrolase fold domain-containing protein n=1 Tax=Pseudofrankia TaxID=2994363 RepID=UPI000234DB4B|nr:hypothetical protein BCD49_32860 [Pseudofrankia sp. EUN1h]